MLDDPALDAFDDDPQALLSKPPGGDRGTVVRQHLLVPIREACLEIVPVNWTQPCSNTKLSVSWKFGGVHVRTFLPYEGPYRSIWDVVSDFIFAFSFWARLSIVSASALGRLGIRVEVLRHHFTEGERTLAYACDLIKPTRSSAVLRRGQVDRLQ
jgi:hypothetical protein